MAWLLNSTFHVSIDCEHNFIDWLANALVPEIEKFGNGIRFEHCLEIMVQLDPDDTTKGYAVQIRANDFNSLTSWLESFNYKALQTSLASKFGKKVLGFNTVMRIFDPRNL